MTLLQIMPDDGSAVDLRTSDPRLIATELAERGIRYEQWPAARELAPGASQDDVLAAYRAQVDQLCDEGGYRLVDVVRMHPDPDDPEWPEKARAARGKFLNEHTHAEDEVRFFVEGRGCFYLHLDERVYAVVCERGDLLSVPVGTKHWFDMGSVPEFCAIRFFQDDDGWVGDFTGSDVSTRIPELDELLAPAPA
jgi:1,2-dihydroxy-3-keto-5-methylthiopentene dioxygenase